MRVSLLAVAICAAVAAHAAEPLDSLVAAQYPAELSEEAATHHYADQREQAYVSLKVGGANLVVAAYSNGHVGAVALMDRGADRSTSLQVIRDHQTGERPRVHAVDLDADGKPEVVITFGLGPRGGSETWIYRVQQRRLVSIGAVDDDGHTLLGYPSILDLHGDGVMDLIDDANVGESRRDPVIVHEHYALRNGVYVALEPVDFYEIFWGGPTAPPKTATREFSVARAVLRKAAKLIVVNGDELGTPYSVSSGKVTLNGKTVSVQPGTRIVPVKLKLANLLTVSLQGGRRGSRVGVVVRHD